jgi:hypothetical protein
MWFRFPRPNIVLKTPRFPKPLWPAAILQIFLLVFPPMTERLMKTAAPGVTFLF